MRTILFGVFSLFFFVFAAEAKGKAATATNIAAFSRVRILEIGSADALYADRFTLLGKLGTVDKGGLYNTGATGSVYYSGTIELDSGKSIYAYQVSVELLSSSSTASSKGTRYTGYNIKAGSWVRILDLGTSDPLFSSRGNVVGKTCFVGEYDLYSSSYGGVLDQFGGQVYCLDGSNHYFSYVSVEIIKPKMVYTKAKSSNIAMYTRVRVLDVSSTDPYASSRSYVVGKEGFVSGAALFQNGADTDGTPYYSGSVVLFNGSYSYFSQVKLELLSLDNPGSLGLGKGIIPTGTKVEIQSIGPLDANYQQRKKFEARLGVVGPSEPLRLGEKGFYQGSVSVDGVEEKFFQVSVIPLLGGLPSSTSLPKLPAGTKVRVLDVSPTDTYAKDKAFVIGKEGEVVNTALEAKAGPWYMGAVQASDGTYLYFSQVSVQVLSLPAGGAATTSKTKESLATSTSVAVGQEVRIVDIGTADSYYSTRTSYMGKLGTVSGSVLYANGTSPTGGAYYSGSITVGGSTIYFYQVALSLVTRP